MEGNNTDLQELVFESFILRFQDLRFGALRIVEQQKANLQNRLRILSACTKGGTEIAKSDIGKKELKTAFVKAWLAMIRSEMDFKTRLQILGRIPSELIPMMPNPLQLSDFLSTSFSSNDLKTSVASLDGLFFLISKHGLDYPLFYQKLYGMLREDVFREAEDPKRFMDLVALLLLRGALVPGNTLAAFIKRLVRRALCWPTCHALWSLRLALDIMRKHPSTSFLVHRTVNLFDDVNDPQQKVNDPFNDSELDPQASRAEQSSLWELLILRKHVSPAMSRLVCAFDRDARERPAPPPGELSDYAGIGFKDIFQAEVHRKTKTSPLAYSRPGSDPSTVRIRKRLRTCVSWS
ncbi:Nucleolar complex protein 4-like [Gracilariopsis chorda]|uniref:Nucleolar complex protein 4-like n=1 Tax=Gracilariopsis chorda TaxID=448386 RepID=A0A2V3IU28_9FLOR|nr:Nucleolar complex protein 4-like [Gracilariopsis chorda]|eukprot:PXF45237.1 Nucleolar complex protein 4-like [Gracilariopsis chorda]